MFYVFTNDHILTNFTEGNGKENSKENGADEKVKNQNTSVAKGKCKANEKENGEDSVKDASVIDKVKKHKNGGMYIYVAYVVICAKR